MQNCTHNKIYDRAADGRHSKTYFDQEVIKIKYTGMSVRYQTAGPPKKATGQMHPVAFLVDLSNDCVAPGKRSGI